MVPLLFLFACVAPSVSAGAWRAAPAHLPPPPAGSTVALVVSLGLLFVLAPVTLPRRSLPSRHEDEDLPTSSLATWR